MLAILKSLYQVFRIVREFVLSLFFILFVLVFCAFVALMQSDQKKSKQPAHFEKGALLLNLDGYLADNHDELGELHRLLQSELGGSDPMKISTFDVVQAINYAADDDNIKGIVLDLSYFQGGDLSSLSFIGRELNAFKASRKPIIAVGEQFGQKQYFLASFADKIYLNKAGGVDLHGLNYSNLYFKTLFDKIEAVPHIFRVGTYKSAVEPFIRDNMSPEAKANAKLWLDEMWGSFSQTVADNRGIPVKAVLPEMATYLSEFKEVKGDEAAYALKRKLVTQLVTTSEVNQLLTEAFGEDANGSYKRIDFFDYSSNLPSRFEGDGGDKIAVVNVEGEIIFGESDTDTAGSDTIIKQLRKARQDKTVKGVILRINSPGGSAMASELIRQEVEAIQAAGKPVVASMGGMAASGGYWIAATSDKIVASPNTLTGSIGIFGLAVTFEKTAKNLGVSEDGIATSPLAQSSGFKTLPKEQGELIQISIDNGYDRFIELVAQGRKMSKTEVDKVAQGQVWSGESAFKKGLVDKLGDFYDAFNLASDLVNEKRKANDEDEIKSFDLQWIIEQDDDFLSQFMRDLKLKAKATAISYFDLPFAKQLRQPFGVLNKFNDPKQMYLYCLNCGSVN